MPLKVSTRADDSDKHELDVNSVIFHKGKLYSGGDDGKIKVWAPDLKLLGQVQAHPCSVYSLSANDDTVFSCSNEGTVKSFTLDLKEKATIVSDKTTEFWRVSWRDGVLYIGDNQGNVQIFKGDKFYASINVAEPVKDLIVRKNLLYTVKDNDLVVTDLHLGGEQVQFGIKGTFEGRGPLAILNNNLIFLARDGKELILSSINEGHVKELSRTKGSELIVNTLATANWGEELLFSSGWDKTVKMWKIAGDYLKEDGSLNVDIIVNSLYIGEKGQIYAAGSDGHIVRLDV